MNELPLRNFELTSNTVTTSHNDLNIKGISKHD